MQLSAVATHRIQWLIYIMVDMLLVISDVLLLHQKDSVYSVCIPQHIK